MPAPNHAGKCKLVKWDGLEFCLICYNEATSEKISLVKHKVITSNKVCPNCWTEQPIVPTEYCGNCEAKIE